MRCLRQRLGPLLALMALLAASSAVLPAQSRVASAAHTPPPGDSRTEPRPLELTVLTYNIKQNGCPGAPKYCERRGDLVSWIREARQLAATIRDSGADVVALQEVDGGRLVKGRPAVATGGEALRTRFDFLAYELRDLYPYGLFDDEGAATGTKEPFGNAILSRFPMTWADSLCLFRGSARWYVDGNGVEQNTGKPKPGYGTVLEPGCQRGMPPRGSGNRGALVVDLDIGGVDVRFISTHFGIYWTSTGSAQRADNAGCSGLALNRALSETNLPTILAGDLNVRCQPQHALETVEKRAYGVNSIENLAVRWDFFTSSPSPFVPALCTLGTSADHCDPEATDCAPYQHQIDYVVGSRSWGPSGTTSDWQLVDRSVLEEPQSASDHGALLTRLRLADPRPSRTDLAALLDPLLDQCTDAELTELARECTEGRGLSVHPSGAFCY